ncbi:MAG: hypothetical protein IT348_04965 [Candidatus Eisenbacteria bacterium]|nr:hypothetical protein [Candidatus Eisenbacteria bacterium]
MNPELWQTRPLLALASILPVPLGAAWMALATQMPALRARRALLSWLTWIGSRLLFAAIVWGALGHQGVDQLAFFLPQARHAMAGEVPYRDFASAYGPLFAPLLALAVRVAGDAGPFVLFLLADFVAWRALAAAEGEESEAAWAYAALPLVWYFTVRYAQDESLGAMFVALAHLALRRDRAALAGLALGVGLVFTKPLFALLALPFVLADRRRMAVLGAAAAPVALVYGALLAWGAPVWQPFTLEGGNFGVGPSLWRVPVVLANFDLGPAGWLPFVALAGAGSWLLARRGAAAEEHAVWQFGAFAALAPKFMPMYAVLWAPQLCVWAASDPDRRGWLLLYGAALPLAWYLDSGPLQGLFGIGWQVVAIAGLVAVALLALWPLRALARR